MTTVTIPTGPLRAIVALLFEVCLVQLLLLLLLLLR